MTVLSLLSWISIQKTSSRNVVNIFSTEKMERWRYFCIELNGFVAVLIHIMSGKKVLIVRNYFCLINRMYVVPVIQCWIILQHGIKLVTRVSSMTVSLSMRCAVGCAYWHGDTWMILSVVHNWSDYQAEDLSVRLTIPAGLHDKK